MLTPTTLPTKPRHQTTAITALLATQPDEQELSDIRAERHVRTKLGWRWVSDGGFVRWAYSVPQRFDTTAQQLRGLSSQNSPLFATHTMSHADAWDVATRIQRTMQRHPAPEDGTWSTVSIDTVTVVNLWEDTLRWRTLHNR